MKLIISIICIFASLTSFACRKSLSNNIFLFNKLIDCPNEKVMIETCLSHNLVDKGEKDGFQSFQANDGTEFRFKMQELNPNCQMPIVEVTAKGSKKDMEKLLSSLGYNKETKSSTQYFKGNPHSYSRKVCTLSEKKNNIWELTFQKILN